MCGIEALHISGACESKTASERGVVAVFCADITPHWDPVDPSKDTTSQLTLNKNNVSVDTWLAGSLGLP